jgi:hypothetical protein
VQADVLPGRAAVARPEQPAAVVGDAAAAGTGLARAGEQGAVGAGREGADRAREPPGHEGANEVPPSVLFQTPPLAAATNSVLSLRGSTATSRTRPPTLEGPRDCQGAAASRGAAFAVSRASCWACATAALWAPAGTGWPGSPVRWAARKSPGSSRWRSSPSRKSGLLSRRSRSPTASRGSTAGRGSAAGAATRATAATDAASRAALARASRRCVLMPGRFAGRGRPPATSRPAGASPCPGRRRRRARLRGPS